MSVSGRTAFTWGWRARIALRRGQTVTDALNRLPALESGLGGHIHEYAPGSAGPDAAAALLARDGRRWTVLK